MNYQYRVRDPMGNTHTGSVEAASVEDATQQLRRDGFQVLELDEADDDGLFPRRISKNDLIYVTSQLAIMVDTGITLSTALAGIVEQETNPTLRRVLKDLKEAVEGGAGLLRGPGPLSEILRQDLRLAGQGQRGHRLAGPDARAHRHLPAQGSWRPAARSARRWPIPTVMMVVATGVTIFLLTYILPKFTPLFKSQGHAAARRRR